MTGLAKYPLLGLVFLASVLCQDRRPTISYITQPEIVTDIGGTIEMKCSVQYGQDYPVIWMKLDAVDRNNDLPISTGTTLILTDPRLVRLCNESHLRLIWRKTTFCYSASPS